MEKKQWIIIALLIGCISLFRWLRKNIKHDGTGLT